jgi:hypothetical protein
LVKSLQLNGQGKLYLVNRELVKAQWAKTVGHNTVGQQTFSQRTVGRQTVGQMTLALQTVGQTTVDQLTEYKPLETYTWPKIITTFGQTYIFRTLSRLASNRRWYSRSFLTRQSGRTICSSRRSFGGCLEY